MFPPETDLLLLPFLAPYHAEEMTAHPVSSLVNNPANDSLACQWLANRRWHRWDSTRRDMRAGEGSPRLISQQYPIICLVLTTPIRLMTDR